MRPVRAETCRRLILLYAPVASQYAVAAMCEFKVFLDGRKVMEDVIFVKADGRRVTLKDVVGETRIFEDVRVVEVNVPATRLVLEGG